MKIFEFKIDGESDYIAADTRDEAILFYSSLISEDKETIEDQSEIVEVPENEWTNRKVIDPDELDENGNNKIIGSFADVIDGLTFPDIIASTSC